MQIGETRHLKICEDFGKMKELRFNRTMTILQREDFCS